MLPAISPRIVALVALPLIACTANIDADVDARKMAPDTAGQSPSSPEGANPENGPASPDDPTASNPTSPSSPANPSSPSKPAVWAQQNSNTTNYLKTVWGADAKHVWAGGSNGTAIFFDGNTWKVTSTGAKEGITSIHGTDASNVYATTWDEVLHWNGTAWSRKSAWGHPDCVSAVDAKAALVGLFVNDSLTKTAYFVMAKFENGTLTELDRLATTGMWTAQRTCQIASVGNGSYVIAERDYGNTYDGSVMIWDGKDLVQKLGDTSPILYASDATHVFLQGGPNVFFWTGGAENASTLTTGYAGSIASISGTSATNVFALGNLGQTSSVLRYDGTGWVAESLPRTQSDAKMRDIWAAPTGELFAVGDEGMVFRKGP